MSGATNHVGLGGTLHADEPRHLVKHKFHKLFLRHIIHMLDDNTGFKARLRYFILPNDLSHGLDHFVRSLSQKNLKIEPCPILKRSRRHQPEARGAEIRANRFGKIGVFPSDPFDSVTDC